MPIKPFLKTPFESKPQQSAEICQAIVIKSNQDSDTILMLTKRNNLYNIDSVESDSIHRHQTGLSQKAAYNIFNNLLNVLTKHNTPVSLIPFKCPLCGSNTKQVIGKYGLFYGCTSYPKCNGIVQASGQPSSKTQALLDKQGKTPKLEEDPEFRLDGLE